MSKLSRRKARRKNRKANRKTTRNWGRGTALYFAYGSNTNPDIMRHRCPSAEVVGRTMLHGFRLRFRGAADIIKAKGSKFIHGVLWRISKADERTLDFYEGVPTVYRKIHFQRPGKSTVMTYQIVNRQQIAEPYDEYFETIEAGFAEFKLDKSTLYSAADLAREKRNGPRVGASAYAPRLYNPRPVFSVIERADNGIEMPRGFYDADDSLTVHDLFMEGPVDFIDEPDQQLFDDHWFEAKPIEDEDDGWYPGIHQRPIQ